MSDIQARTRFADCLAKAGTLTAGFKVDVAYLAVCGSHAHGFATEQSDVDLRGVYMPSMNMVVGMAPVERSLRRETPEADVTLSAAVHFAHGLARSDIQTYEMISVPEDLVKVSTPFSVEIRSQAKNMVNRNLAIKIVRTAQGQIKEIADWAKPLEPGTKDYKRARHSLRLMEMAYQLIETHQVIVRHPDPQAVYDFIDTCDRMPNTIDSYIMERGRRALGMIEESDLQVDAPADLIESIVGPHYRQWLIESAQWNPYEPTGKKQNTTKANH